MAFVTYKDSYDNDIKAYDRVKVAGHEVENNPREWLFDIFLGMDELTGVGAPYRCASGYYPVCVRIDEQGELDTPALRLEKLKAQRIQLIEDHATWQLADCDEMLPTLTKMPCGNPEDNIRAIASLRTHLNDGPQTPEEQYMLDNLVYNYNNFNGTTHPKNCGMNLFIFMLNLIDFERAQIAADKALHLAAVQAATTEAEVNAVPYTWTLHDAPVFDPDTTYTYTPHEP